MKKSLLPNLLSCLVLVVLSLQPVCIGLSPSEKGSPEAADLTSQSLSFEQTVTLRSERYNKYFSPGNFRGAPVFSIHGYNDQVVCWQDSCPLPLIGFQSFGGWRGWHLWADVNECNGSPTLLSSSSNEDDHKWDKAYLDCLGGVEVRQILNSKSHMGEWRRLPTNGYQFQYVKRIWAFLSRWSIPTNVDVYEHTGGKQLRS